MGLKFCQRLQNVIFKNMILPNTGTYVNLFFSQRFQLSCFGFPQMGLFSSFCIRIRQIRIRNTVWAHYQKHGISSLLSPQNSLMETTMAFSSYIFGLRGFVHCHQYSIDKKPPTPLLHNPAFYLQIVLLQAPFLDWRPEHGNKL
jgi:hypothetical protein